MAMDSTVIIVKKKVHGGHAHHGGSWKVAYADFVTAMMAFFMVMWILGLSDASRKEVASYFKDPFGKIKAAPKSDRIFSVMGAPATKPGIVHDKTEGSKEEESKLKEIEQKVKADVNSTPDLAALMKFIDTQVNREGLRIEFTEGSGSVFFESGSAVIRPEALKLVARIAPALIKSGHGLIIEGHTDAQAYASTDYTNIDLSEDRARSLYHALMHDGMPVTRFRSVRGYGASELKDPEHPLAFTNRRVSILIPFKEPTPASDGLPKDALKKEIKGAFKKDLEIAP